MVEKQTEALTKNIVLTAEVFLPSDLRIKNEILSIIIGNLLDNAYAAVLRHSLDEKEVSLKMKYLNKNLLIEVENTFDSAELISRIPRKNVGYGIRNVKQVVETFGGIYEVSTDNQVYKTTILLLNI